MTGIAALALAATVSAQQPPVFGARIESVYVDAFVSRGGAPVQGLDASQFELKDDGRVQRAELLAVEAIPLTTLLVFDTSESVRGAKLEALRAAAGIFLHRLRPADEAGLISFSDEVRWLARPSADHDAVRRSLGALRAEGPTAVWDALSAALSVLPVTKRSLIVLFTDGEDNLSWLDARGVRAQAARSNALVHVVGMAPAGGESVSIADWAGIAESTGGRYWRADSPADLAVAFQAIVDAMNTRYVLRYDPGPDAKPGWHPIELRLKGVKGEVRARQGYWRAR